MAKPTKYPRRLRRTLEKVADGRREREAKAAAEDDVPPLFRSFYQSGFLTQVQTIHTRFNDAATQATTIYQLHPLPANRRIFVPPPWILKPKSDAS
jgi:hypothetical protein